MKIDRYPFGMTAIGLVVPLLLIAKVQAGAVLYVDDDAPAPAGGDGLTWNTPMRFLQDAIAVAANPANGINEIHVAQGVYRPDRSSASVNGSGDRSVSFVLHSGVALRGGYVGLSAQRGQDPDTRDISAYPTILSGDLAGNDLAPPPLHTLVTPESFANGGENSYHVLTAFEIDETAVLEGFTITGGYADGPGFGADPASQEQGSGLNVYYASPTVAKCTFIHNYSFNHAALNDHGYFTTVTDCVFRANYSENLGPALYSHHQSATTATNCQFYDNLTLGDGAGGYSLSMRFAAYVNCHFEGNSAGNKGGGMYNAAGSTTTVTNCEFIDNHAYFGGGVYCDESTAMLNGCTIENNSAVSQGGGVYCNFGSPTVTNCQIVANVADGGGAGEWNADSDTTVTHCTYRANTSAAGGAGLYNLRGNPSVSDCLFTLNISGGGGGGMWNGQNSPSITNCTFISNTAISGGGLYNTDFSSPSVSHCIFTNNVATEGGGLYNFQSDSTVADCTFTGNSVFGGSFSVGGGLANYFCSPVISQCEFTSNQAELGGGGMYNEGDQPTVQNCSFAKNRATGSGQAGGAVWDDGWGGGMMNGYFAQTMVVNCQFTGNNAHLGGGVFNMAFSTPQLVNCTIVANAASPAPDSGGGVFGFQSSAGFLTNSIVWHNSPNEIAGVLPDVQFCCVEGGVPRGAGGGVGNIDLDPKFVIAPDPGLDGVWATDDDADGDLRLAAGSPCIDGCDNSVIPAGVTVDLHGDPRFMDDRNTPDTGVADSRTAIADMGAYEFQPLRRSCGGDVAPAGGDGVVNVSDLLAVINAWGAVGNGPADVNHDGQVNVGDLLAVINAWGTCP